MPGTDAGMPGEPLLPSLRSTYHLTSARNEYESFQLVLQNKGPNPINDLSVAPSLDGAPKGNAQAEFSFETFWEHYVFIYKPSGNANGDPLWYPDALIPLSVKPTCRVEPGGTVVVWITVYTPKNAQPGSYAGRVAVNCGPDGSSVTLPFTLRVEDYTIPVTRHFCATGALYYEMVRDYYNKHFRNNAPPLQPDSPEWIEIKKTYYEYLLNYRFTPYDLPVSPDSPEADKYLNDPRVNCFRLPWIGEDDASFRKIIQTLRAKGRLSRAYYYQADEPAIPQYADVIELATRLRKVEPHIRHLVTIPPVLPLSTYVDIWCPNIGDALNTGKMEFGRLQRRRRLGEETWWYTMTVPRYPYPTWLVDDDGVSPRMFLWMSSLYGFTGCVYSMIHGWSEDPYTKVESFLDSNGDGLLIYPGESFGPRQPFPSIRLQLIRDALEDYEMLQQLDIRTRDKVCRALIQDLTRWDRRPERIERIRTLLLEHLSRRRPLPPLQRYHQPEWPSRRVIVSIPRVIVPPTVDGVAGESEWCNTQWLADFTQSNGLRPARAAARAKVMFDNDNLYVLGEGELLKSESSDPLAKQWFAVALDPFRKWDRYFFFAVTAKGNSHTELRSSNGVDPTWTIPWQFKSSASGERFTVEMTIPFAGLGYSPKRGDVWGFNLLRRSREETSAWQANYGDVSLMPGLRFE